MEKEYKMLLLATLVNKTDEEEKELDKLFSEPTDWEKLSGQLFIHRLGGYFYSGLNYEQKMKLPKELRKILGLVSIAQKRQTLEVAEVMKDIYVDFDKENVRYAGLKGLVFNASVYEPGYRRSNDSDLLVYEGDLEKIDVILRKHGYIQTLFKNREYKEATRKEKLIQIMNYHDLVPYVKIVGREFLERQQIDINFHFDSKTHDITKDIFDYGTTIYENNYYRIKGLPWETNLAHLCVHFRREASNSLWVNFRKDILLYKLVDIINVIRSCEDKEKLREWPDVMKKFGLQETGYYTMYHLSMFFDDDTIKYFMKELEIEDKEFLNKIVYDSEEKMKDRKDSFSNCAFDLKW